jgi:hypothetical protein
MEAPDPDCPDLGCPTYVTKLTRAFIIARISIFLPGRVTGKRLDVHMGVINYPFPVLVSGRDSTQLIRTRLKDGGVYFLLLSPKRLIKNTLLSIPFYWGPL